jgi:hypothetical protein
VHRKTGVAENTGKKSANGTFVFSPFKLLLWLLLCCGRRWLLSLVVAAGCRRWFLSLVFVANCRR